MGSSGSLAAKYAWRNRATDAIGFAWMGGNWLDPQSGSFLSFDPLGHLASDSGYSFSRGNPLALSFWDADGRGKLFNARAGIENLAAINQQRIANGLLPMTADGYAPCVVCHGMSASGPVPGVPLTYNFVGGQVYNSGGNRHIIGNYAAGAAGQIASIPQQIGNFIAYPFAMMAADDFVPMGDYLNAAGTQNAVQQAVYANVDSQSLLTTAGGYGGDALLLITPKIPLPTRVASTEASTVTRGMRIRLNPRVAEFGGINLSRANAAQRVVRRPPAPYWESRPQYYISDGVRRSLAARESGNAFVRAKLVRPGRADEFINVHLDQLHSPKPSINIADPRFNSKLSPDYPMIEIQPLGTPGQLPTTPLLDVEIY